MAAVSPDAEDAEVAEAELVLELGGEELERAGLGRRPILVAEESIDFRLVKSISENTQYVKTGCNWSSSVI